MLIQFSVRNFRTFKEKATLSLIASNNDKDTREVENVSNTNNFNLRILKSAVIYGANASGKSKFIEALMFMKHFAINSSKDSQKGDLIQVEPFKLNPESENEPSEFEVIFIFNKIMYRYGFEVDRNCIVSEWLFHKPKTKEVELFYRDFQKFEIHPRDFQKGAIGVKEGLIRDNALLLSLAAQFNDSTAINVINWFSELNVISGLKENEFRENSINKIKSENGKSIILDFLKKADFGIVDLNIHDVNSGIFKDSPYSVIFTKRNQFKYKTKVGFINFSLALDESEGTKKYFYLLGPIIDAIENGSALVVDELDSKIHPNLVEKIVSLFNSKKLNPKNAQLVFNSHDTNLLSSGLFRKDQIWFTEKDKYGEARLYSLADFKSDEVRKKEAFEDNYVRGKYGAVPFLGFFDNFIHNNQLPQDENEE
ncbi:MAG: abortive infection protein [Bacteroidetes bacterium GWA2_30_7]|nr:MAG: abortive infection protein [Bacteroidetes bacterium GWA2_30_7]